MRGRRINAFRSLGFGHVREYTPVALLHKAAFLRATLQASTARLAAREILDKNAIFGTFMGVRNIAFFYITWSVFAELICRKQIFCLYGFPRSYEYGKIRVRLMRTEEDVNENEGHFVSVGARLVALPR